MTHYNNIMMMSSNDFSSNMGEIPSSNNYDQLICVFEKLLILSQDRLTGPSVDRLSQITKKKTSKYDDRDIKVLLIDLSHSICEIKAFLEEEITKTHKFIFVIRYCDDIPYVIEQIFNSSFNINILDEWLSLIFDQTKDIKISRLVDRQIGDFSSQLLATLDCYKFIPHNSSITIRSQ